MIEKLALAKLTISSEIYKKEEYNDHIKLKIILIH